MINRAYFGSNFMRSIAILAAIFAASGVAAAQGAAKAATTRMRRASPNPLAVDHAIHVLFGVHEIWETAISPDGQRVAWAESLAGKNGAPSPNKAIYVADWKAPAGRVRVSAGNGVAANEGSVAWSPDSNQIAFLSDAGHAGQQELYVATPGEAARELTHVRGDLAGPKWSPDGKTIAMLFIENAPRASGPLAAETRDEGVVGAKIFEQRLALVEAATGRMRQISPAGLYVYEYDWSPDSQKIVATAAPGNGDDDWYIAQIRVFNTATGADHSIYKPPVTMQMGRPKWSPDGSTIAFISGIMSDEGSVGGDIYTLPAEGGEPRDITPGLKATPSTLDWGADSKTIRFGEIVDGESGIAEVHLDSGAISTIWTGPERIGGGGFGVGVSLSRDGKFSAVVRQSFSEPPEVWAGPTGAWKQVTTLNQGLQPAWGEAKSLHWKTGIGEVQGWVVYPLHFEPGKKYPLIVSVHGGPAAANLPNWPSRRSYEMALPAAGYFLLFPNPRGSFGMGEAFTRANVKDFGGGDFRDIMAGVDEAIKTLPVDPERLGITGWSYGGDMSMWAVTQTDRFKAAVIGAGLSDWLSYYGENQIDKWMIPYFGASVYEDPAVYAKSAPIDFVKNVKTPSLLVVGDSDGECPPPQSYEFWHALVYFGVPTEFVIYPHEGHGFVNPAHSRDVAERAVAWFNSQM
jgi:dipeptidyl aminopeptidase/acylaminoacyl peptidase